jgi:hypothetical protein
MAIDDEYDSSKIASELKARAGRTQPLHCTQYCRPVERRKS